MRARLAILAFSIAASALALVSPLEELELRVLDAQFRTLRAPVPTQANERIVVVGIDDHSVESITEPLGLWHGYLARFLEALKESKPALVAFDIVMPDRSFEGIAPGFDRQLLRALISTRDAYPTLLAITIKDDGHPRGIHPAFIAAAGTAPGYALWPVDADGIIRRFDEDLGIGNERVATLLGEVARHLGKPIRAGYIDYALGPPFHYLPFGDVLAAAERGDRAWLHERFAGKVVLLGMASPFTDSVRVPVRLAGWDIPDRETPGVLLHAQALRTILADRVVSRAPAALLAAITLLGALAALLATIPIRAAWLASMLIVGAVLASPIALARGTFLPLAWPLVTGLIAIAIRQGIDVALRLAERRRLRSSFAGSVSPAVMQQILDGRITPKQGGVNVEVCVLFSDIRGYTTLSEGKTPAQIVDLLNRYFDRMVTIIHDAGGTVVSFMGDGIMAVFGAPQPLPNSAAAAFDAAVHMLDGVREFNRELEGEGVTPIAIGIGLHVGEALVGHIGSRTRHDYTAIGDVTNVASRLESATKEAGYRVVISREVAERLSDCSGLEALGPVAIKGHTPVEAFGYERVQPLKVTSESAPRLSTSAATSLHGYLLASLVGMILAAAAPVGAQRAAGALALISDLQGSARIVRGKDNHAAKLLADVFPETRVEVDAGARLVLLMLASGEEVTLRGPAAVLLSPQGVSAEPAQALSRRTSRVGGVQLRRKDLAQAAIVMRKTDQTVRPPLLSLAGTLTLEDPPVFRWTSVESSGPYRVTLFDDAGAVLYEAVTGETEHTLPASVSISRNRRYTWEVSTRKANGVEHTNFGDFAVASTALRDEAARRRPAQSADFSERLAYAVWLDTNELGDAAREIWKQLAAERPGDEQLRRMAEQ